MPSADRTPESLVQLGWLDALTRHRRTIYAFVALCYLAAFNGIWRVGVDSALYRGLARSLVRGDGYTFAGEHHQHAYPGVPWMLALLEWIFGSTPVPGLIVMTLMALATLWLVDRLISLRFPVWVAVIATVGMAFNVRFLRQSQQLMTDIPFTLGVVASFYALERLRLVPTTARWTAFARWGAALVAGLSLAAATRPTFGVLAIAISIASIVGIFSATDGRRWLHAGIVAAAMLVVLALLIADPRTRGIAPMQGVYEQELVERVQELPNTLTAQLNALLARDLNDAFFGQRMAPVNYLGSALLLLAAAVVLRRNLAWGLTIFGLILVTLPLSTVPRYYLMVMPFMWVGWAIVWSWVTLRVPAKVQGPLLAIAMVLPLSVNFGRSVDLIIEQRRPDVAWLLHGKPRHDTFYETYRDGSVPRQRRIADMIAVNSTPKQKIIGPEAHVLAYFADRRVIGERTLFIDREAALSKLPQLLFKAKPDLAIFPTTAYGDNDSLMRDLIRRRILVADHEVARVDDVQLGAAVVRLPPPGVNWKAYRPSDAATRRSATTRRMSAAERAELIEKRERRAERAAKIRRAEKLERQAKLEKRAKVERQAKRERAEKRERVERRERLERRERQRQKAAAATQTTTQPSAGPATQPSQSPP